jgi:hypothetical protein
VAAVIEMTGVVVPEATVIGAVPVTLLVAPTQAAPFHVSICPVVVLNLVYPVEGVASRCTVVPAGMPAEPVALVLSTNEPLEAAARVFQAVPFQNSITEVVEL